MDPETQMSNIAITAHVHLHFDMHLMRLFNTLPLLAMATMVDATRFTTEGGNKTNVSNANPKECKHRSQETCKRVP